MPHEPWTVDQELSRLGESIKTQQQQDPDNSSEPGKTADNPPRQQIHGSRNIQVGGDLALLGGSPVDPHHPDAMRCAQCQGLTYRRSDRCTQCHFNLSGYRIERARQEKRHRLSTVIAVCGIPGLLLLLTGTKYVAGTVGLYLLWVGGALVAAAALATSRGQRL